MLSASGTDILPSYVLNQHFFRNYNRRIFIIS
jgi:hypothetical protein